MSPLFITVCLPHFQIKKQILHQEKKVAPAKWGSIWVAQLWQCFSKSAKTILIRLLKQTINDSDITGYKYYVLSISKVILTRYEKYGKCTAELEQVPKVNHECTVDVITKCVYDCRAKVV